MRGTWHEIAAHRATALLFLLYWLGAYGFHMFRWHRTDLPLGRDDMVSQVLALHLFLPSIAGGLVAWWRAGAPQARVRRTIVAGLLPGVIVFMIDAAIVIAPSAIADVHGEGSLYIAVPVSVMFIGCVGAVLGLTGALVSAALSALLKRFDHHGRLISAHLNTSR